MDARPTWSEEVAWFSRMYQAVLEAHDVAAVAEVEGRAVGLVHVHRPFPKSETAHVGTLGISIRRGFRNRGVGTAMMRYVLEKCRGRFEIIELTVFAVNTSARRLYEKFGFVGAGRVPNGVRRSGRYHDLDRMVLDLTRATGGGGAAETSDPVP